MLMLTEPLFHSLYPSKTGKKWPPVHFPASETCASGAASPTFSFLTLTQGSLEKLSVSAIWMSAFSSSLVRSFLTWRRTTGRGKTKQNRELFGLEEVARSWVWCIFCIYFKVETSRVKLSHCSGSIRHASFYWFAAHFLFDITFLAEKLSICLIAFHVMRPRKINSELHYKHWTNRTHLPGLSCNYCRWIRLKSIWLESPSSLFTWTLNK